MDFKFLEETQPKFIKLINNSIKKDRLAQVYLFDGVKGTPKMQGAMYLASKILCEHGNNCGECKSCLMLSNGVHPDLITISPTRAEGVVSEGTIKKEQIEDLIHEFSLASPNKRVFIINEIEIGYYKNNRWCLFMNNRFEIAREFAESINSDKIVKIILFGSVARGDDTENSDIDILIISDYRSEIWDDIVDMIGEFVLEKQELISAHIMSTDRFNTTQDYSFLSNVLAEGEVLV